MLCFGVVVDTKNVDKKVYKERGVSRKEISSYDIIGVSLLDIENNIVNIKIHDIEDYEFEYFEMGSTLDVERYYGSKGNLLRSVYSIYTDYAIEITYCLPVYSENGELLYCVGNNIAYYSIKRSLLIKVNSVDLSVDTVSGVDAMIIYNRINSNKTLFFGTSLNWDSELSPEVKYGLLNKIGDGVYSFGDSVIIENTMERFVLSENTKCVDIDFTDLGELVCNESLESVCITGGMPDRLYISKNSSEKLICSILYSAMCSDVLSHEALVLKKYMEEKILASDYATLLKDCRLVIYRSIIKTALHGVEIIVY